MGDGGELGGVSGCWKEGIGCGREGKREWVMIVRGVFKCSCLGVFITGDAPIPQVLRFQHLHRRHRHPRPPSRVDLPPQAVRVHATQMPRPPPRPRHQRPRHRVPQHLPSLPAVRPQSTRVREGLAAQGEQQPEVFGADGEENVQVGGLGWVGWVGRVRGLVGSVGLVGLVGSVGSVGWCYVSVNVFVGQAAKLSWGFAQISNDSRVVLSTVVEWFCTDLFWIIEPMLCVDSLLRTTRKSVVGRLRLAPLSTCKVRLRTRNSVRFVHSVHSVHFLYLRSFMYDLSETRLDAVRHLRGGVSARIPPRDFFEWLGLVAFVRVFSRKQSRYKEVLLGLRREMDDTRFSDVIKHPHIVSATDWDRSQVFETIKY